MRALCRQSAEKILVADPNSLVLDSVAIMITVPLFDSDILVATVTIIITIIAAIAAIYDGIDRVNRIWLRVIARISAAQVEIKINVNFRRSGRGGGSCKKRHSGSSDNKIADHGLVPLV